MLAGGGTKISIERLLERQVDEITHNGEETYIKPHTRSEELAYFASKVDFHGTHEDIGEENDEEPDKKKMHLNGEVKENGEVEGEEKKDKDAGKWAWETVHSKLRIAVSEVCVMLDVLECLHRKKYLVLDPIQQNPEPSKQTVQMLGSRKCLAASGATVAKGARSLTMKKKEPVVPVEPMGNGIGCKPDDEQSSDEYYMQLMHLRQYWRVKKTGVQVTGDVTFRSAGSMFWHPGLFEVKAAHDAAAGGTNPMMNGSVNDEQRKLVVNVSTDLQQLSTLSVEIKDQSPSNPWSANTEIKRWKKNKTAFDWENDLQLAQLHIFNLEIFSLLSNDAFQGSYNNIQVLDGRICCRLLDDVEVSIVHHVEEYTEVKSEPAPLDVVTADDMTLLLTNLLLTFHEKNTPYPSLYPATSNHHQRPLNSSSVHNLLEKGRMMRPRSSILHDFLLHAQHKVWVTRLMNFLDQKSACTTNSVLQIHWSTLQLHCVSTCSLLIVTRSYAVTTTTTLLLTVDREGFKITFENSEKITLPFDLRILEELIDSELRNEMIKIANCLCVQHRWKVMQTSTKHVMCNNQQNGTLKNGSIFYSHSRQRYINMYVLDTNNVEIEVSTRVPVSPSLKLDDKFSWLNMVYAKLPWDSLPGRNFAEKIENMFLCV